MIMKWAGLGSIFFFTTCFCAAAESVSFPFKGIAYISYRGGEYKSRNAASSLDDMKSTGANSASVLVTWYMRNASSTAIKAAGAKSPRDADVRKAIRDLHARGIKVMLKPHVDVRNGTWRGEIAPTDTARWFLSYGAFITKYAKMAQEEGVELFCVVCELRTMSGADFAANWATVISDVRKEFLGPLTYAANASSIRDEFQTVSFWNLLDYAGADVYFPLTSGANPSVAELVAAWSANRLGENFLLAMQGWQAQVGKPVMFTEIGYQSAEGTNITPWWSNGFFNATEQQNCYEAAFQVWSKEPWLQGMFWWGWTPKKPRDKDTQFNPRGKPAQTTLQTWYGSS